ncbi:MAG: hypothetical protein CMJ67_10680 [Planctomycetaceae bacterium]|nr:hypothetical protein [Planctomycetaceae bacterium]
MRIFHVLRKPLSEGTVAANTLKHGTGGLNIDVSRITSDGSHIVTGVVRRGKDNLMADRTGIGDGPGMYAAGSSYVPSDAQKLGRWPANVILQHLDGCRCDGDWICEPGCPVARLDADSLAGGMHSAGSSRSAKREAGKTGMFPMDGDGHRFGDTGGASRFYKQIGGEG